jgi:hypothetical protein
LLARNNAVAQARQLLFVGVHKQITNRLIEPWLWQTIIVTATEWDNFFGLRRHPDAQPEIKRAADLMYEAMQGSKPSPLAFDEWHLPLVTFEERNAELSNADPMFWQKVSAGRCARVSYLTHDGKKDFHADVELATKLQKSGHVSPWEHPARPMNQWECKEKYGRQGKYVGDNRDPSQNFCANFRGWVQMRKLFVGEDVFIPRSE